MANVDVSLYNALGARPKSMADYDEDLARQDLRKQQVQQNALMLQQGQLKADEYQRGVARQNALGGVVQGFGGDHKQNALKLYQAGYLTEAQAYEKAQADAAEKTAEAGHKTAQTTEVQIKAAGERLKQYRQALDLVDNPQAAAQWLQAQFADPLTRDTMAALGNPQEALARIPQDPQGFMQWRQQAAMGMEKHLKQKHDEAQLAEQTRNNQAQNTVAQGQLRVSQGQLGVAQGNLGVRRAELEQAKATPRGQFLETPSGYVLGDPRTGAVAPVVGPDGKQVVGKAADRALTDSQAKANLFGTRMQESDKILGALEGKYSPMAVKAKMSAESMPLVGGIAGYGANLALSDEGQQAEQAQRDFVNAVLRRESGAVISDHEFANAQKQYFPQPGDSKAVLEQKRKNRKSATDLMLAEVPTGKRGAGPAAAPAAAAPGKAKFLGFE